MASPASTAKRARVESLRRHVPYCSQSALAAICKDIAKNGLPELSDRKSQRQARNDKLEDTPYGPVIVNIKIECTDGSEDVLVVTNPFALLHVCVQRCEGFRTMLKARLQTNPSSIDNPWRLILYSDEVVPGNQLSFHNMRKLWAVYWSLMEFGMELLCMEDAWFCASAQASDTVKQYNGGVAAMFCAIIKTFFENGPNSFSDSGMYLDFGDGFTTRIFLELGMIIQDGGAHKHVFMVKGEGGHKLCMLCRNLYAEKSGLVNEDGDDELTCSLIRETDLDFAEDNDLYDTVDRLAETARLRPGQLKLREQAAGFNHHPKNILLDPLIRRILKPVSHFAHDWMHTFVVHGVFNTVMYLLMMALIESGARDICADLTAYIRTWAFPKRLSVNGISLSDAFSPTRWTSSKKARYFKVEASQAMTLYGLVACYLQGVFLRANVCVLECMAFIRLADMLDMLVELPHKVFSDKDLRKAADAFLKACVDAGWQCYMHPKFHWVVHLARELKQFGFLVTCWVTERKHRMVKRYSEAIKNNLNMARSILSEVTCHHFHELGLPGKFDVSSRLLGPRKCPRRLDAFLRTFLGFHAGDKIDVSTTAQVSIFEKCHRADVVVVGHGGALHCALIYYFLSCEGSTGVLLSLWPTVSTNDAQGTVVCNRVDNLVLVDLVDVKAACSYRRLDATDVCVLLPLRFRGLVK